MARKPKAAGKYDALHNGRIYACADGKALYILTPSLAFRGARDVAQVPCNAAFAMSAAL
jgi:hypothetical protein